ncbi:hypothetical protein JI723_11345 [Providencia manganoxydans]|uniref:DUF3289 family protein n=1 Tax=Providencia manganoxydans TaxID=2923283 RepID=A0ABX7AAC1_9GAMM|nr:hypothetical protein JI723_11345 [Providencia manganoxydans]
MTEWAEFVDILGKSETSQEVKNLCLSINEDVNISIDPIEHNDPIGRTKYYSFIHSGIEIGFRGNILNHIHFYFNDEEGYGQYKGKLISDICAGWDKENILKTLGEPSLTGGGKMDMLLGYIDSWIKYQFKNYDLNFQFKQNGYLSRCSLISK